MGPFFTDEEKGADSEERFFRAAAVRLHHTPPWLIGIMKADVESDLRGIDAFAYVRYPKEWWAERIPIQIKSSWERVDEHKKKHPELAKAKVVYMVMLHDRDDDAVRTILYAELDKLLKKNVRFEKFLVGFLSSRLKARAEQRRQNFYSAEMKDLRYSMGTPPASEPLPLPEEVEERTFWQRVLRWLFPAGSDRDWKPWSWMIPSHW